MENTINFGIDLGTTNSAIAKFVKGEIVVFKNPLDYGRSTLPSVVSYRKDKIIVGQKAKEFQERDPKSVIGTFKRKMGTSETFKVKSTNETKSPVELSAQVLKELKTFVNTGDILDAVVITIPASFDMIQSNATKEAGYQAGFKQVLLLQEPIAASLAYANMRKSKELNDGQWLVYDLGGGTFDVALVRIKDGEMKIIDHEGDNFLGGADFDQAIVEKLVIPKITSEHSFGNLEEDMKSASGKYNAKWYVLLRRAEEAKIALSSVSSAEIVVDGFEDEEGEDVDMEITITKSEFKELIKYQIDSTVEMVKTILTRNNLTAKDIHFNLMVGGSTYIPYVRQRVEEVLQIPVNCEIDPTTAVAVGAAYYAATKPKEIEKQNDAKKEYALSIKASYQKASKETEELFAAKITGDISGLFYKIVREDGGFDSGLKKLTERISEDLPLVADAYNFFTLTVYDEHNNVVETGLEQIGINSGFSIVGQPLPEDISIEVDDLENPGETKLMQVFQRNTILPTRKQLTFPLNKTVLKGNNSDAVSINVYEGPSYALPEANKLIGTIRVDGNMISRDISKGSDIEITLSISESRDLNVSAYLYMSDQDFKETFKGMNRHTSVRFLQEQVNDLSEKLDEELNMALEKEDFETADALKKLQKEMLSVSEDVEKLSEDDVTDSKFQIEDKKRKVAQEIDNATKGKRIDSAIKEYEKVKERCSEVIEKSGNDYERKAFNDIVSQESAFMATNNPLKIDEKISEFRGIIAQINWRTPDFLIDVFNYLLNQQGRMNNPEQAKSYFDAGRFAIESQNWERLKQINYDLFDLLPDTMDQISTKIGFSN